MASATLTFLLWPVLLGVVIAILLLSRIIRLGLQVLLALLDDLPLLFRFLLGCHRRLLVALRGGGNETIGEVLPVSAKVNLQREERERDSKF